MIQAFENFKKIFESAHVFAEFLNKKEIAADNSEIKKYFDEILKDKAAFDNAFRVVQKYCPHYDSEKTWVFSNNIAEYRCNDCGKIWTETKEKTI